MPTPSYEIPSDMRDMAEKSFDQASRAFDGFMTAAQKAAGQTDTTAATVQSNAKSMGTKAMGFAETNVRSAFDLARKLVRAKDLQEVFDLQSAYAKTQMTTIQDQAVAAERLRLNESRPQAEPGRVGNDTDLAYAGQSEAAQIDETAFQPTARALAVLRGVEIARRDLIEAGGTYSALEVQHFLDIHSEQELDELVNCGNLFTLRTPRRELRFPVFQFDEEGFIIDGIDAVRKALPTRNPWAVLNFMTRPHWELGSRRPIDLLKLGQVDLVLEAARNVGVQGG